MYNQKSRKRKNTNVSEAKSRYARVWSGARKCEHERVFQKHPKLQRELGMQAQSRTESECRALVEDYVTKVRSVCGLRVSTVLDTVVSGVVVLTWTQMRPKLSHAMHVCDRERKCEHERNFQKHPKLTRIENASAD